MDLLLYSCTQLECINLKGVHMTDFKENLLDFLVAIGLGLALCFGLLAYFDILWK